MKFALLGACFLYVGCAQPCIRHSDCPNQLVCQLGGCVMPALDGDVPDGETPLASDGGADALMDAGTADVMDADVMDADVTDADVTDADVTDAEVTDAEVTDADLTDAGISDASLGIIADGESYTDVTPLDVPLIDLRWLADSGSSDAGDGT